MKTNHFDNLIENHTIITGGHFLVTSSGPVLNEGTINSFQQAVDHFCLARKQYSHVGLGILINDIGTVCSGSTCSISARPLSKESIQFPEVYREILQTANISEVDLVIYWEKHLRNRGKKLLAKELVKNTPHIVYSEGGYLYDSPEKSLQLVLTRYSPKDKYGTPACPLIMCAYALEQKVMGFEHSLNFYYVGDDNYSNIANHYVIEKGRHLADILYGKMDVKNIYLFKTGVLKNECCIP